MPDCDHEEADYRICVHVNDALHKGARNVLLCTVDTDVIVILACTFFRLHTMYPDANIWGFLVLASTFSIIASFVSN